MRDFNSHEEKNSGPDSLDKLSKSHKEIKSEPNCLDRLLKDIFTSLKQEYRSLLNMDIERKKAIVLTFIIMTLSLFLGSRDVFLLNHILCISRYYTSIDGVMDGLDTYLANYVIFLILWSPAIYFLSLYWNSKTIKFRLCLSYAIGLLTYRLNHDEWGLYNLENFVSCLGLAALFVFLTAIFSYYIRKESE